MHAMRVVTSKCHFAAFGYDFPFGANPTEREARDSGLEGSAHVT
jgi:hypothetical protein